MTHLDRLSSLISHFEIAANSRVSLRESNLVVTGDNDGLRELVLFPAGPPKRSDATIVVAHAHVDIGGEANPLFHALPERLKVDLTADDQIRAIAELIVREISETRCGGRFALDRLCELLVVTLLRNRIEHRGSETGLFAGLAHPRLSRVMVAMHDAPGRRWQIDDFVEIAAMSRSQFISEFQSVVGKTPMAYLKQWRLVLARIAIMKGQRINKVARQYGYGSGDAFTRAFTRAYGVSPSKAAAADHPPGARVPS